MPLFFLLPASPPPPRFLSDAVEILPELIGSFTCQLFWHTFSYAEEERNFSAYAGTSSYKGYHNPASSCHLQQLSTSCVLLKTQDCAHKLN